MTPRCGLCWRMFHVHLRRCILLLDGMSWRYQWDTFHIIYHLRVVFPYSFCFDDVSIGMRRMLKSPTITVLLSISPFMSISVCLTYWGASMLGKLDIYNCYAFLLDWSLDHYVVTFLVSCNLLYFKVYFVWYEDCYSSIPLLPICMECIFPSSHFQSICVFRYEMGFFRPYIWVLCL